MNLLLIPI